MPQTREFHKAVVAYLAKRVKGGCAPDTVQRCMGDYMEQADFYEQLSNACGKGRAKAKLSLHKWATTGKAPSSTGVAGFVLSNALAVAQHRLGVVSTPTKIVTTLGGPPWTEDIANEIVNTIFDDTAEQALDKWIEEEAGGAFKEWEKGYRGYYEGPDS